MNKVKLNRLSDRKIAEMQMNNVRGGAAPGGMTKCPSGACDCGCCGPSNISDNASANRTARKYTSGYCDS
jgi:natural product precursor